MLKDLYNYRAYILYSVKGRLISTTIKNHLGLLWLIFEPILRMFIYYFVFVYLLERRTDEFMTFLLVGIIAFMWFSQCIIQGANSICSSGGLIQKVYLPKVIFPTIHVFHKSLEFIIVIAVMLLFFTIRGDFCITYLAIPVIFMTQLVFTYGITLVGAGIVPFVPDLSFLITYGMTALFFLSGVFFEIKPGDPRYDTFMLNPMAKLLEQYRLVILHNQWPDITALLSIALVGVIIICIGAFIVRKFDYYYPRIAK